MLIVSFKPSFLKKVSKLEKELQEEVAEKVSRVKDPKNHTVLKVHKLHGKFSGRLSFSVNYKVRIVFVYESKKEIVLLDIDDHDIYK